MTKISKFWISLALGYVIYKGIDNKEWDRLLYVFVQKVFDFSKDFFNLVDDVSKLLNHQNSLNNKSSNNFIQNKIDEVQKEIDDFNTYEFVDSLLNNLKKDK